MKTEIITHINERLCIVDEEYQAEPPSLAPSKWSHEHDEKSLKTEPSQGIKKMPHIKKESNTRESTYDKDKLSMSRKGKEKVDRDEKETSLFFDVDYSVKKYSPEELKMLPRITTESDASLKKPAAKRDEDTTIRVTLLGYNTGSGVGKTTLLHQFINNKFIKYTKADIGLDFQTKSLTTKHRTYKLLITDIACPRESINFYKTLIRDNVRMSNVNILFIDLTDKNSIDNINRSLELRNVDLSKSPLILIGTRADDVQLVSLDDILHLRDKLNALCYIETSAKYNVNVHRTFYAALAAAISHQGLEEGTFYSLYNEISDSNYNHNKAELIPSADNEKFYITCNELLWQRLRSLSEIDSLPESQLVKYGLIESSEDSDISLEVEFSEDETTPLFDAVTEGNHSEVRRLLEETTKSKEQIEELEPLLFNAIEYGYTEVVRTLLEFDVDSNAKNIQGSTALHVACLKGHHSVVELLLDFNADPSQPSLNQFIPIFVAAYCNRDDIVRTLIKHDPNLRGVEELNDESRRPCVRLLSWRNPQVSKIHNSEEEIDPEIFLRTCKNNDIEKISQSPTDTIDVSTTDVTDLGSELITACLCDNIEKVKKLLNNNPTLIRQRDSDGLNILMIACSMQNERVAGYLVSNHPSLLTETDNKGRSVLTHACLGHDPSIVRTVVDGLIAIGNVREECINSLKEFEAAEPRSGSNKLIYDLLTKYAYEESDTSKDDNKDNTTPDHTSEEKDDDKENSDGTQKSTDESKPSRGKLPEHPGDDDPDKNMKDEEEEAEEEIDPETFLEACETGAIDAVRHYLAHGGNIDYTDDKGNTGLIRASIRGDYNIEVIRVLIENGADRTKKAQLFDAPTRPLTAIEVAIADAPFIDKTVDLILDGYDVNARGDIWVALISAMIRQKENLVSSFYKYLRETSTQPQLLDTFYLQLISLIPDFSATSITPPGHTTSLREDLGYNLFSLPFVTMHPRPIPTGDKYPGYETFSRSLGSRVHRICQLTAGLQLDWKEGHLDADMSLDLLERLIRRRREQSRVADESSVIDQLIEILDLDKEGHNIADDEIHLFKEIALHAVIRDVDGILFGYEGVHQILKPWLRELKPIQQYALIVHAFLRDTKKNLFDLDTQDTRDNLLALLSGNESVLDKPYHDSLTYTVFKTLTSTQQRRMSLPLDELAALAADTDSLESESSESEEPSSEHDDDESTHASTNTSGDPVIDAERQFEASSSGTSTSIRPRTKRSVRDVICRFSQMVLGLSDLPDEAQMAMPFNEFDTSSDEIWQKLLSKINHRYLISTDFIRTNASINEIATDVEKHTAKCRDLTLQHRAKPNTSSNKHRTLFIMPPIMGSPAEITQLCKEISGPSLEKANISLYTFRSSVQRFMMEGKDETTLHTIEAQAAIVVDAIRAVQPEGPYHLCGWSYGGVLAWEVARQLSEGDSVNFIGLIDPQLPHTLQTFSRNALINRLLMHINYATKTILGKEENYTIIKEADFADIETLNDDALSQEDGMKIIDRALTYAKSRLDTEAPTDKLKQKLIYRYATLRANYTAMYHYTLPILSQCSERPPVNTVVFVAGETAQLLDRPEYSSDDIMPFTSHPEEHIVPGTNHFDVVFGRGFMRNFKRTLKHLGSRKVENQILRILDAHYQQPHFTDVLLSSINVGCSITDTLPNVISIGSAPSYDTCFTTHAAKPRRVLVVGNIDSGKSHTARYHILKHATSSVKRWTIYIPFTKIINHINQDDLPDINLVPWMLHKLYFQKADIPRKEVDTWWRKLITKKAKQIVLIVDDVDKVLMVKKAHRFLEYLSLQPCDIHFYTRNIHQHVLRKVGFYPNSTYTLQPLSPDQQDNLINHIIADPDRARLLRVWLKADEARQDWASNPRHLLTLCEYWLFTEKTIDELDDESLAIAHFLELTVDNTLRRLCQERGAEADESTVALMTSKQLRSHQSSVLSFVKASAYTHIVSDANMLSREALNKLLSEYSGDSTKLFVDVLHTGFLIPLSDNLYDIQRSYGFKNQLMMAYLATQHVIEMLNNEEHTLENLTRYLDALTQSTPYSWLIDMLIDGLNTLGVIRLLEACGHFTNLTDEGIIRLIMPLCDKAIADESIPRERYAFLLTGVTNAVVTFTHGVTMLSDEHHTALTSDALTHYHQTIRELTEKHPAVTQEIKHESPTIEPGTRTLLEHAVKSQDVSLLQQLLQLDVGLNDVRDSLQIAIENDQKETVTLLTKHLVKHGYQALLAYLNEHSISLASGDTTWQATIDSALATLIDDSLTHRDHPWHETTTNYRECANEAWLTEWKLGIERSGKSLEPVIEKLTTVPESMDAELHDAIANLDDDLFELVISDHDAVRRIITSFITISGDERFEAFLFDHDPFENTINSYPKIYDATTAFMWSKRLSVRDPELTKDAQLKIIYNSSESEAILQDEIKTYVEDAISHTLRHNKSVLVDILRSDMRFLITRIIELYKLCKIKIDIPIVRSLRQAIFNMMNENHKAMVHEYIRETWLKYFNSDALSEAQDKHLKILFGYEHEEEKADVLETSSSDSDSEAEQNPSFLKLFSKTVPYTNGSPHHSLYGHVLTEHKQVSKEEHKKELKNLRDSTATLLRAVRNNQAHPHMTSNALVREHIETFLSEISFHSYYAGILNNNLGSHREAFLLSVITNQPIIIINSDGDVLNAVPTLREFTGEPIFLLCQDGERYELLKLKDGVDCSEIMAQIFSHIENSSVEPEDRSKGKEPLIESKTTESTSPDITKREKRSPSKLCSSITPVHACLSLFSKSEVREPAYPYSDRLVYLRIRGDGHCFFRAAAEILGEDMSSIRRKIAEHMTANRETYISFFENSAEYETHLTAIRTGRSVGSLGVSSQTEHWGGDPELSALSHRTCRPVVMMQRGKEPRVYHQDWPTLTSDDVVPIFVLYNGRDHYDALLPSDDDTARDILREIRNNELATSCESRATAGHG